MLGQPVTGFRVASPAVLRTYDPPYDAIVGKTVLGLRRVGKRIVLELEDDLFLVIHLMIAGRLQWKPPATAVPRRLGSPPSTSTRGR